MVHIGNDWDCILADQFGSEYYKRIRAFLKHEYSHGVVYPDMYDIFNAFKYTAYSDVKVVILGQDPYHGPGQAHGLAFSVQKGIAVPPSLVNIYKEIKNDLGIEPPSHGCLTSWAQQGVLLLNTALTVRAGQANSHKNCGWAVFTDAVVRKLGSREQPTVFMLWGSNARSKAAFIDPSKHLVLQAPHPSPLSAYNGFFGCRHFSKANAFLGNKAIDWRIPE